MKMPLAFALAILSAATSHAQTPPAPPAPPPSCTESVYRAFDFWLGEWTVTDPAGAKAGENSITAEEGGCLLVERWRSASGGSGQSYNFFDPGARQWRQLWVSTGAVIDYSGGLNDKGEMELRGLIHYRDGHSAPFMGIWSKQADGSVRQHFEEFDPASQTWTDWFTGIYRRK